MLPILATHKWTRVQPPAGGRWTQLLLSVCRVGERPVRVGGTTSINSTCTVCLSVRLRTGVDSSTHEYYGITDGNADVQGHRSGSSADPFQGSPGACHGVGVPATPGEYFARTCAY